MSDERDKSRKQIRDDLAYVLADDRTTPRGIALAKHLLDELKASERDRASLSMLRPGECSECKGTGEDWSNAAPTPCEACRGSTCGVVCDLVKNENCLQMAREDDREHLSKTVALAERDRRNLLGLNDAVKGPGGGRAQLREWIAAHPEAYSLSSKGLMADLLIDIDSAERDREALAGARELLKETVKTPVAQYPGWKTARDAFLKRTEPKP